MGILTREQIDGMGFFSVGENVRLSDRASYYNCANISIGNNSRIDDFCVIAAGEGGIQIGCFVHIAVFCSLIGRGKIVLDDFSGLSARVSVYSSSDDYTGLAMTNPTIPEQFTNVKHANVSIERHVIVGAGSVLLPGINIAQGTAIGALSLVTKSCEEFSVYTGNPAKRITRRKRGMLELEKKFLASQTFDSH
ncbi:MAG TPA: acyltransferase [Pseudomonadales bacterium]|nr:acyltransferase [Pseudomonadales bacterium]